MNRVLLLSIVFFICFQKLSYSQFPSNNESAIVKGIVLDKETRLPLPYASVGVLDMPYGTVSDSMGHYSFIMGRVNSNDSVQISMVGYFTIRISVRELLLNPGAEIFLEMKHQDLPEVIVSNRELTTEEIGRTSSGKLFQVSLHKKGAAQLTIGSEFGIKLNTSHSALLKNFNWFISNNNFKRIKLRLNVYSVKHNFPDTLICKQQIFANLTSYQKGWIRIDLEDYKIAVAGDFIITLQWLEGVTDDEKNPITMIPVSMTPFSKKGYARIASQDKWQRLKIKPSYYATIVY